MKSTTIDYIPSRRLAELSESETYSISNYRGQGKKLIVRFAQRVSYEEVYVDFYFDGSDPPQLPDPQNLCSGKAYFQLNLLTDDYGGETSWSLKNAASGQTVESGSDFGSNADYPFSACINRGVDYIFEVEDTHGDGICCAHGQGSYSVSIDGEEIASGGNFEREETTSFSVSGDEDSGPSPTPA